MKKDLNKFMGAQERDYQIALTEIKNGRKKSHWMWYIFPQIDGLAFSSTSQRYAIKSRDEARAYLDHPVLGPSLGRRCSLLMQVRGVNPHTYLDLIRKVSLGRGVLTPCLPFR